MNTSAMDLLPTDVFLEIATQSPRLREDLLVIPDAEAAGWFVQFRNDNWHNAADFHKDNVTVRSTGRYWRRVTTEKGRYVQPTVCSSVKEALGL